MSNPPRLLTAIALFMILAIPISAQTGLPLEVVNPSSAPMVQYPVTFGIPIPAFPGHIFPDLEALSIAVINGAGTPVPHQYKALSRWNGERDDMTKSLKWVQVTFLADCPANSTNTYYLGGGWRPAGTLGVTQTATHITLQPRQGTTFVINRQQLRIFESAVIDGHTVVAAPGGGLRMNDVNGLPITPVVTETVIEETGSVRTVIRQRGTLNNLRFTMRYQFHSGQAQVGLDFRLENPGAYGTFFGVTPAVEYFDFLNLYLPVQGATGDIVSTTGAYDVATDNYEVKQSFAMQNPLDLSTGFFFDELRGQTTLTTGSQYEGVLDLSGPQAGVSIAIDRFSENFPKAFEVNGSVIEAALWPSWGNGPEFRGIYSHPGATSDPIDPLAVSNYRFEGGRWKTHRVVFDFHSGQRTPAELIQLSSIVNKVPMGRAPAKWVADTHATGEFIVERRNWTNDIGAQRYEKHLDAIVSTSATDDVPGVGHVDFREFRNRGGTYGGLQFYGWDTYGDIMWASGASSLHYDWPYGVLVNWLRGGSYDFFDIGRDMAVHRRDYDQNHTTDTNEWWRGAAMYEKGWWHGNNNFGQASHTWLHGILMHYAITGDEGSREAALEGMKFMLRETPRNWTGLWGARVPGWTINNLMDCWNYLGIEEALTEAGAGLATFQQLESNWGTQGYVLNTASIGNLAQPWMHSIVFHAGARYTILSGDPTYLPMLYRMKEWLATCIHYDPNESPQAMTVPSVTGLFYDTTGHVGDNMFHDWYLADTFSIAAILWHETVDIDRAWLLFQTCARFHQNAATDIVDFDDEQGFSDVSLRLLRYPNTESKIVGGILRSGHSYMLMRTFFNPQFGH